MRLLCRSCHITVHHTYESWSLIYLCAMRIMPCVVTYAMKTKDVIHTSCDTHVPASWLSLDFYDAPEIAYWHAIHASQMTSPKIASHFCTLNNENADHAEKDSHCHVQ